MNKIEIIAHPAKFTFMDLVKAILNRVVTTEELQESGELDPFTLDILREFELKKDIFRDTPERYAGLMEYYRDLFIEGLSRRCQAEAVCLISREFKETAGMDFNPADIYPCSKDELRSIVQQVPLALLNETITRNICKQAIEKLMDFQRRESEMEVHHNHNMNPSSNLSRNSGFDDANDIFEAARTALGPVAGAFETPGSVQEIVALPLYLLLGAYSRLKRLFSRGDKKVYADLYAPKSVETHRKFRVQVHLYNLKQAAEVAKKAKEIDKDSSLMDRNPLGMKLKKGDRINLFLSFGSAGAVADESSASLIWTGEPVSAQFFVKVLLPVGEDLTGKVMVSVNDATIGVLSFLTRVNVNADERPSAVKAQSFKKAFISYAHEDEKIAKAMASAYHDQGKEYFLDLHNLESGDVFDNKIQQNIEDSDLFVLLWSKNAEKSEYVAREYRYALRFAQPKPGATLFFRPHLVDPVADPPADLKSIYHFSSELLGRKY